MKKNTCLTLCHYTQVEIDYLSYLIMTQGEHEFTIVENSTVKDGELSSTTKVIARNGVHVKSIIPTRFFSYDGPSTAKVSGIVFMKLAGSRRRLGVVIDPELQATRSRALASRDEAGFNINILLEKSQLNDVIVNDANESNSNVATNALTREVIVEIAASAVVITAVILGVLFVFVFRKRRRLENDKKLAASEPVTAIF